MPARKAALRRAQIAVGLTTCWSAIALTTRSSTALAVLAVLASLSALLAPRALVTRGRARLLVITGLGLVAFTALQLVPLPMHLLRLVSPHAADVWSQALAPFGAGYEARWAPLSLDPTATRVQVLRGLVYVQTAVAATRLACTREGALRAQAAVVVASLAVVAVTAVHAVVRAPHVWGLAPVFKDQPRWRSPFLNPNVLAALLAMGATVALGLALEGRRGVRERVGAWSAAGILLTALIYVGSRGAVVGELVAVLVLAIMIRDRSSDAAADRAAGAKLLGVACCVVGVATMLVLDGDTWAQYQEDNLEKLNVLSRNAGALRSVSLLGVGRGAFASAFRAFDTGTSGEIWEFPENVVVQWWVEWGAPVGVSGLGAIAWALRPNRLAPAGVQAALVGSAVHAMVGFHTESPGVMVAAAVCAGIAVGVNRSSDDVDAPTSSAFGDAAGACVGLALGIVIAARQPEERRPEMEELLRWTRDESLDATFDQRLAAAMARHPAEFQFPYLGAVVARRRGQSPGPWARRVDLLAPTFGLATLEHAAWLLRSDPRAAAQNLRRAMEKQPDLVPTVVQRLLPYLPGADFDLLVDTLPANQARARCIESVARAVVATHPSTAVRLGELAVADDPAVVWPARERARAARSDLGAPGAPWCNFAPAECAEAAERASAAYVHLAPRSCEAHALHAEVARAAERIEDALERLSGAVETADDPEVCLRAFASIADEARLPAQAIAALERATTLTCLDPDRCADALVRTAAAHKGRGRLHASLAVLQRAYAQFPERDDLQARLGDEAAALGQHALASTYFARLAARDPGQPRWAELARREREAAGNARREEDGGVVRVPLTAPDRAR